MEMFRLDYLSCLLTVVATILVGRKSWIGLVVSGVNSLIICVIGVHTSQYGFIPANVFCICINAFNLKLWLNKGARPDQISTLVEAEQKDYRDRQQSAAGESGVSAESRSLPPCRIVGTNSGTIRIWSMRKRKHPSFLHRENDSHAQSKLQLRYSDRFPIS